LLKDCIEIFARELEKTEEQFGNLEKFILDSYIPADGDYIVVQKDGTVKSRSFKLDKKTRTLNGMISGSQLDDDIKFYDYHSRLVSKDKPQDPKKAIHSNNYLSFWIKWNKLDNMELVMQAIDRYYKETVISSMFLKETGSLIMPDDEDDIEVFKYAEKLPVALNGYTNLYEYADICYTNMLVDINNDKLYDLYKTEGKVLEFY